MMENKRNAMFLGMVIGVMIGIGVGLALENIGLGVGLGVAYGTALGVAFSKQKPIKDKKKARIFSWTMLFTSGLGFLLFGTIIGDVYGGVSAAIGISFVIGLKWERLYDERISGIFNKAARNAFVTVNAGLSFAFLGRHLFEESLSILSAGELTSYIVYFSWIIFLISWIYHGNYLGE